METQHRIEFRKTSLTNPFLSLIEFDRAYLKDPLPAIKVEVRYVTHAPIKRQECYALMRRVLRPHLANLDEERKELKTKLRYTLPAAHAALMDQVSPLFGETPASLLQEVDAWCTEYARCRHRLRTVTTKVAEARKEHRIITKKYKLVMKNRDA